MKLTKSQHRQTLKTFAVLAFSQEFRDTVAQSIVSNARESFKESIAKYKHLIKNQSTFALARAAADTAFESIEVGNAYELEDISSESSRNMLKLVIETYQAKLGWSPEDFNNLVDTDFTRLKLTEKIQIMMANPREGSAYYEGEAKVKEALKPFTETYEYLRDELFQVYGESAQEFFNEVNPDYERVGKGKYVHKDLLEQHKYTQSSEYHLTTTHGLTVENASAFIDPANGNYHLPENVYFLIHLHDDKEDLNKEVAAWIKENNYQYGVSETY